MFTAVSGALALGVSARLTNGGRLTDGTDSARARIVPRHGTHAGPPEVVPVVSTSQGSVDDAAARMAGTRLVDQPRRLPGVRMGSQYCGKYAKEGVVSPTWTPIGRRLGHELGRPMRTLKIMGLRNDESCDRRKRPPFQGVRANSARIVDEWLPIKDWSTEAEWHSAPVPYRWTYDSVPGAGDWLATSCCSCSFCVFASKPDALLARGRRPRLAALYAEVEQVRGDSFCAGWRITDLLRHAEICGTPRPGHRLPGRRPGVHRPRSKTAGRC